MSASAAEATTWQAFENKYRQSTDPWNFASSAYELSRYGTLLRALPASEYSCVYEPGCSVGILTRHLASIATRVIATDFAPSAVEQARRRCLGLRNVEIEVADVRQYRPSPAPDLIVFSEIGYYFSASELSRIVLLLSGQLAPGGQLLAAHWLGHSADHVLHGDEVHAELCAVLPLRWTHGSKHNGFRIDSWRKG